MKKNMPQRGVRYANDEERKSALKRNARKFQDSEAGKLFRSRANRKAALKRHGLTVEQYDQMLTAQNGRCAVCRTDKPSDRPDIRFMFIDHCHKTGKVRGLLCNRCNTAIGYAEDDPVRLEAMASYLRHNS